MLARLARWRIEIGGFGRCALNGNSRESSREDASDPVGRGVEVVYPIAPEDGELGVRADNAIEEGEHNKEEWKDVADDSKTGCKGCYPLTLF